MKVEFTAAEVNVMLRKAVQERFPHIKITHLNMTTYDHLMVDMEDLRALPDQAEEKQCPAEIPFGNVERG